MSRGFSAVVAVCRHRFLRSRVDAGNQPQRYARRVGRVVLSLWLSQALLVLMVLALARRQPLAPVVEPPPSYLPGGLLPEATSCDFSNHKLRLCSAEVSHQVLYFLIDTDTRLIRRTVLRTGAYTLGQLIAAWGTPTGMTQRAGTTLVHWRTRSLVLYTTSLRPNRQSEFIVFDLEPPKGSPWRGFIRNGY